MFGFVGRGRFVRVLWARFVCRILLRLFWCFGGSGGVFWVWSCFGVEFWDCPLDFGECVSQVECDVSGVVCVWLDVVVGEGVEFVYGLSDECVSVLQLKHR